MADDLINLQKKLGKNIKKIREAKGFSLWDVSHECAIDASKIAKIEKGQFNITLRTINELCKGLNISPTKLFDFF